MLVDRRLITDRQIDRDTPKQGAFVDLNFSMYANRFVQCQIRSRLGKADAEPDWTNAKKSVFAVDLDEVFW